MPTSLFHALLTLLGATFAAIFAVLCIPPLLENPDIVAAAMAGFVNPFSSGYALDAIFCWLVLAVWVIHEARTLGIRHGWVALVLGAVPGVATGFALYLLMRARQLGAGRAA